MAAKERKHEDGFALPTQVGRYRILAPIGSGGMATVLLARAEGIGGFEREVALKVLHPHLMKEQDLVRQFLTEARIAARIRHPNVVPVLDVGEHSQGVHLVMEHVQGDSLAGLRRRSRRQGKDLPPAVWMRIFTDSLLGLHAAHELADEAGQPLGVVHRDFTPHNILVGTDGVSRLCDFGVVKVATSNDHTATGIVKGKLRYLSPEQARGRKLDRRCDVWAAGVTAWELFTEQSLHPQQGDPVDLLLCIAMDTPPRMRSVSKKVPEAIDEAVAWALTVDVEHRCPSAEALRERLVLAWGGHAKLATIEEVADWVQSLCAEKLARLAHKIERFQQIRDDMGSLVDATDEDTTTSLVAAKTAEPDEPASETGARAATDPDQAPESVATRAETPVAHASTPERTLSSANLAMARPQAGRPGAKRLALGIGGLVGIVGVVGVAWQAGTDEPLATARVAWGDLRLPELPSSARPASSAQITMTLETDQPVVALRVDGKAIPLEGQTREVVLELTEPAGSTVVIEAKSKRGRQLREEVVVRAGRLKLSFRAPSRVWRRKAPDSPYE